MNSAVNTLQNLGKVTSSSFWHQKINKVLAMKISLVLTLIVLLGLLSWQAVRATSGKILPRVTIAGLKVGGKTPDEAKIMVKNYVSQLNNQGPKIVHETHSINPHLSDIGVSFNPDRVVNDAYSYGRSGNWLTRISDNSKMVFRNYNISLDPKVNSSKLDKYLSQIIKTVEVAPVSANLVINNGNISVTPSKPGLGVDENKLKKDLVELINRNELSSQITLKTTELTPQILEAGTTEAKAQAEKYMASAPINVTYSDRVFTASCADVGSWIVFNPSGNKLVASVSSEKVSGFAGYVASQIEIPMVNREIMEGTGQVLNEGQDGLGVDSKRLANELKARVLSQTTGNAIAVATYAIAKGEIIKNPHAQPCRFAGRYIDINLSEQTLYAFEGCNLVNQYLISSGVYSHPTPTGQFYVYAKSRVTEMNGPGYDLPGVEWVSWWSGDYSIHGTYWHHNFGTPMSHGCINASNADAEWTYNWDDIGTPVYIHY